MNDRARQHRVCAGAPVSAVIFALLCGAQVAGCTVVPVRPDGLPEPVPVDELLRRGARTMWIGAHPDDELLPGPLLARSSIYYKNPCYLLVLNHGDGGECGLPEGCRPDLATIRGGEMKRAAAFYRARLQHERYFNAPLPVSSFPKRHELYAIWKRQKDPVRLVALAIRSFRPDLVLTFDPDWGATGHPEHQLSSRVANAGIRLAADGGADLDGMPPHVVGRTYYVLSRNWLARLLGRADPGPVTETWDATTNCTPKRSCLELMLRATRFHRTQRNDMESVRRYPGVFARVYLRQVDPFKLHKDPASDK